MPKPFGPPNPARRRSGAGEFVGKLRRLSFPEIVRGDEIFFVVNDER